jgi:AcrR family transcriptional regulator
MGRAQTWDEAEVLAAARRVFREHGFAGTSVRRLQDATGVHPGSLYHVYGDKQGLFTASLRSYNEVVVDQRVAEHLQDAADPRRGIRSFFVTTFAPFVDGVPGCLVTNTAIESTTLEPSLRRDVDVGLAAIERGFRHALDRLATAGRLPADAVPARLAEQLLALYQGVLVLVRAGTPTAKLTRIVDGSLDALLGGDPP